jgi:hypothetical protein
MSNPAQSEIRLQESLIDDVRKEAGNVAKKDFAYFVHYYRNIYLNGCQQWSHR